MSNFVVVSDTTNLATGGQINYTLSSTTTPGSEKTLEVLIRAPNGTILASSTNSYDNRSQIQSTINRQLDNKQQLVEQELTQVRKEISFLTSIINNPNTPPDQRSNARSLLPISQEEQTKLENEQNNIIITRTRFNATFTPVTSELNEQLIADQQPPAPTPPPPAPAPTPSPTANAAVVTSNAAPTTSTGTPTTAPLTGAASDDSGAKQDNPAGSTGAPPSTPAGSATGTNTPAPNSATQPNNSSPEAQSTGPALRTEASKTQPPGKRLKNPLGYFSSYNYQLSLYMITPDAYDAFIQSGRKNINAFSKLAGADNGGAYLIAQSGGINNKNELRAPGFGFDYSIDNLTLETITNGKAGEGDSNTTEIKFTITEPYGFSFVSNLRKAQYALEAELAKNGKSIKLPQNPTKQFFILGIRFYGYDEVGNLMKGAEVFDSNTLDPNAPGDGSLFQRYYDIVLTEMKFKIDGKAVTYNISAASLAPASAFSIKRGQIDTTMNIEANDVEEAINSLVEQLNNRQKEIYKNSSDLPNTYKVKFLGEAATLIGKAKLISPADLDKFKWPGSGAKKTADSNDQTATKNNTPNKTKTQISFSGSPKPTPIPAAISEIITQSQFLEQGLKTVYTTSLEPPKDKTKMNQIDQNTKKVLKWYNISSELSNAKWNEKSSDWVYDITYLIQVYETPVIDSVYANVTTKYYGPHKRYNYWYTGQNSEIISYVSELNNAYFTVAVAPQDGAKTSDTENPSTDGTSTGESGNGSRGSPAEIPVVPAKTQDQPTTGKLGGAGKEAQNSYITSLYDPASQATATIQILGDPDFIMVDSSYSEDTLYQKFYGADGYTVNPNGGQVFIEIDFKEAVDYSVDSVSTVDGAGRAGITGQPGTLSINESILFWNYPKDIAALVKGIQYMVLNVTSQFSDGQFKQTLACSVNTFNQSSKPLQGEGREPAANNTNQPAGTTPAAGTNTATGASTSASNATNADSGLKADPSSKPSTNRSLVSPNAVLPPPNEIVVSASSIVIPSRLGIVVDDDASGPILSNRFLNSSLADAGRETTNIFANTSGIRSTLLTTTNIPPPLRGPIII
jgi:hypothetical protein